MRIFDSGRVQDKIIKRLERQERQQAFQRDRFFSFKLPEIHNKLTQALLMDKIVETENPAAVSNVLLKGLNRPDPKSRSPGKSFFPVHDPVHYGSPYK